MITKEEFKKTYMRMMDSCRENTPYKGEPNCKGLSCNFDNCPFYDICCDNEGDVTYNAFEAIEIVEKWGKEHPVITRADKYKEIFGIQPAYNGGEAFICPGEARGESYCCTHSCNECKEDFWNGEYIEPKKEN